MEYLYTHGAQCRCRFTSVVSCKILFWRHICSHRTWHLQPKSFRHSLPVLSLYKQFNVFNEIILNYIEALRRSEALVDELFDDKAPIATTSNLREGIRAFCIQQHSNNPLQAPC